MTYRIEILPNALRELRQLLLQERQQIDKRVQALSADPRPSGVIAMQGERKELLQVRVSNYRVIYSVEDECRVVVVVKVGHYGNVYRD